MDSITGSSLIMRGAQTQQALSTAMMKQAADQQKQLADMLSKNVQQASQTMYSGSGYNFSTYA